jgi:hypothetical protein
MASALLLGIVILGFAVMFGGSKAAGKLIKVFTDFASKLVIDLVTGVLRLTFSVLDKGLRALGRLLERGVRRLCRLPVAPRQPQLPPPRP